MLSNPRTLDPATWGHRASRSVVVGLLAATWLLACPADADASLMSPELEDAVAKYIAIFALFFVPVLLIVLFWMVHVLPEKIAHKRHHPQFEAIRTLCLLSLVFGGLLWPLAWLWAYTKPVGYKLAYGTDKIPTTSRSTAFRSRRAPPPTYGSAWPRSKGAAYQPVSSTPFAPTWQQSSRGWRRVNSRSEVG